MPQLCSVNLESLSSSELDELIEQLTSLVGVEQDIGADDIASVRARDRERKNTARAIASAIEIPRCVDRKLREELEADDIKWLMFFFGPGEGVTSPYTYEFTSQQRVMIGAIAEAIQFGSDQAIAASRGEGKSLSTQRLLTKYALTGEADFSVLFTRSGRHSERALQNIKVSLANNERLHQFYPEACVPIRNIRTAPQKARGQLANGYRHDTGERFECAELAYSWCGHEVIFPRTPGAPSYASIIATRGLDSEVRGINVEGRRPKLCVIDDPDDRYTALSEERAEELEIRIDAAIEGLGGQQSSMGRVMLTTIQSRISVSFKYTDPKQKPSWKGRRFRYLITPPDRKDMWEHYMAMRVEDLQQRDEADKNTDPEARRAHRYVLDNYEEMHRGAVVANPNRYDARPMPDGTTRESSALQAYYNKVAKVGQDKVSTEYDNDPPEDDVAVEETLHPTRVQKQVSGLSKCIIPNDAVLLTQGIDVRKRALHWVVRAWMEDGTFYTIDYGYYEVRGTEYGADKTEGVHTAIVNAICELHEETHDTKYITEEGGRMYVDLALVDAGWQTDAVYAACLKIGERMRPVMGFGKSSGCTQANFHDALKTTKTKRPGDNWFWSKKTNLWLCCAHADHWKSWEHDRWMTSPDIPGCGYMFGVNSDRPELMSDDQKNHHAYARHITNEAEIEDPKKGRIWRAKNKNTHWLDASYYANVAANIRGIRLAASSAAVAPSRLSQAQPVSLADLAKAAKAGRV